jgi:hypothetical protein
LPKCPYRALSYYDRNDRDLFAGRDGDVMRFARILDESATRVLVLHGESGCGKSSFLRAGVIPFLEGECRGYRFVRDRSEGESPSPLFIRTTKDLPGQVANALLRFCGQPLSQVTPEGQPAVIDLPDVLGGRREVAVLRQALLDDPSLLGRMLADLGQRLPFLPVLVMDQAEEVFTLAREKEDEAARTVALEMLRQASEVAGRFKIIVALRTEYYGRFVNGLRHGVRPAYGVREYLLTDLDEEQLAEAILRPTTFREYGFSYAAGVAQRLASKILTASRNPLDSVLPLAQVICTQLYDQVAKRQPGSGVIGSDDIKALGDLTGGMKRHVEEMLGQYLPYPADRSAFRRLLSQLYHTQPDGTLTTAMMPVNRVEGHVGSVEENWQGNMPLPDLLTVMTDSRVRLLRRNTLFLGGGVRRDYVSLGHDALAPVAREWKQQFDRNSLRRRRVMVAIFLSAWALGMTAAFVVAFYFWTMAVDRSEAAETKTKEAEQAKEAFCEQALQLSVRNSARLTHADGVANGDRLQDGEDLSGALLWSVEGLSHEKVNAAREAVHRVRISWNLNRLAKPVRIWYHPGASPLSRLSPDGRLVLTSAGDGIARVWDVETGR